MPTVFVDPPHRACHPVVSRGAIGAQHARHATLNQTIIRAKENYQTVGSFRKAQVNALIKAEIWPLNYLSAFRTGEFRAPVGAAAVDNYVVDRFAATALAPHGLYAVLKKRSPV
jgi:hypothetical protein